MRWTPGGTPRRSSTSRRARQRVPLRRRAAAATRSRSRRYAAGRRRAGHRRLADPLRPRPATVGSAHACRLHRLPRRRPRLLRRPRGRQHQVVLGDAQGTSTTTSVKAPMTALTAALEPEFGDGEGVPALPRRALRQGQDAVQDPPGRVRRRPARPPAGTSRSRARGVRTGAGFYDAEPAAARRDPRRRSPTTAPAPSSSGSLDDAARATAGSSAATGSRPRPAGTTPTTRASTCCGTSR